MSLGNKKQILAIGSSSGQSRSIAVLTPLCVALTLVRPGGSSHHIPRGTSVHTLNKSWSVYSVCRLLRFSRSSAREAADSRHGCGGVIKVFLWQIPSLKVFSKTKNTTYSISRGDLDILPQVNKLIQDLVEYHLGWTAWA